MGLKLHQGVADCLSTIGSILIIFTLAIAFQASVFAHARHILKGDGAETPMCTGEGLFGSETNTSIFYRCTFDNNFQDSSAVSPKYKVYTFACPPGTTFDKEIKNCNYAPLAAPVINFGQMVRRFVNRETQRCLDSNSEGHVYTLHCNRGNNQLWEQYKDGKIKNVATGNCLNSNSEGHVYAISCNGGNYQRWRESGSGWALHYINYETGRHLDSNEFGNVYAISENDGQNQQWANLKR